MKMKQCDQPESMVLHPCFAGQDRRGERCIHLPVAPACNIECRYCKSELDRPAEGQAGTLMTIDQAVGRVRSVMEQGGQVRGAVVSGPGEPLANAATYVVLRQLSWMFPGLTLGIATNGLLLRDRVEQIIADGVRSTAITINAFTPDTARSIYSRILYRGRRYAIEDGAEFLIRCQWEGLMLAVDAGLHVSVNTRIVPGVNEDDIVRIADRAAKLGARQMQILFAGPDDGSSEGYERKKRIAIAEACSTYLQVVS